MKVINYIKQKKVPGKVKATLYCGKKIYKHVVTFIRGRKIQEVWYIL